ncbi:L-aspartate oxidase [Paremcibacter congregatus]|uniref:L-aspartate oxidase n=1 Tax=Paremcibacter congregatus TaxID=2043170 RepID=A0A2G4YPB8_9PROT|nr:L-aspartate oxidase [Paremcibacter congregatus]PHZ84145.1 L-aspartate oxidase [Paremcibacter congregatus]QDE25794.1 L-aspartate oxidase [Paremcibacter congregatus]
MSEFHDFDVLVIGSGAAGLTLGLKVADHARVAILSKNKLNEGSTNWAQGGIAAVLDTRDTIESHIEDTMIAGAGLCHRKTVAHVVEQGREAIAWLVEQGVAFTKDNPAAKDAFVDGDYHLTKEGGHSFRRVVHATDATGKAVQESLEDKARRHPNITLFENHMTVDLISDRHPDPEQRRCLGAYVLDTKKNCKDVFRAKATVLATGGASRVYLYTSNPDGSTGDGIAMAWRFGCRVANMEFNQFHPTCLYHPETRTFLLTEALRGEGAYLRLPDGERFMNRFDARLELAPRDIVARAIDHEMKRLGIQCVYLDISHKEPAFIKEHFPTIYERCLSLGYDLTKERIPVVPAAHYTCGGVMTDLSGQTDVSGLYAIGEVAHTGLHGANRMASNSLLECLVYADSAARDILQLIKRPGVDFEIQAWDESRVMDSDEEVVVSHNWNELRHFMWDYVGIVRSTRRLERAARRVDMLAGEIREFYSRYRVTPDSLELRNLVVVADLIIRSALARTESRGLHYMLDYPKTDPYMDQRDTILRPPKRPYTK